ncbi:disulfide bond formation protein DsbA [Zobellella denitrificans]|jgi:protein-disulfide isomerase|uniref:Disulfide bond formation protein DsbA n=1 Tax=Zobellella denitrificans TaxID=347534 RepID=A0A231N3A4_9GAMM|nr:DsbA family protein [Zobellella denitrificans]ATG74828.1 disulfide bond formation protein DsbA [Zobellella denitrificans]OXS16700.1 disulfide bond formation protein DsbA [Zobellella denitrificans]
MKQTLLKTLVPVLALGLLPAAQAEMSREEFKELVRETLLERPEILREAIIKLEENDKLAQQQQFEQQLKEQSELLFANKTDGIMGNPRGKIEMVYFTDYNCPYCRRLNQSLLEVLKTEPELKVIVKDIGILGPDSVQAARLALAAAREAPRQYEELHQALMSQQRVQAAALATIADKAGLDAKALQAKADSKEIADKLTENLSLFRSLGLNGTPALVFPDGTLIPGAIDAAGLKEILKDKQS